MMGLSDGRKSFPIVRLSPDAIVRWDYRPNPNYNFTITGNVLTLQASCDRRTNCADSATYDITDPEPEPKPNPNPKTHPNPNPIF